MHVNVEHNDRTECFKEYFSESSDYLHCLQPLLRSLGWVGDTRKIVECFPHYYKRCGIKTFTRVMNELNFSKHSFKAVLKDVDERLLPCLFVPDHGSAMVIHGVVDNNFIVTVGDGKNKKKKIHDDEISGTVHLFRSKEKESTTSSNNANCFVKVLQENKKLVYHLTIVNLLLSILMLGPPIFVMAIYDQIVAPNSYDLLGYYIVGIGIIMLGVVLLQRLKTNIMAYIGYRLDEVIGDNVFSKLIQLPIVKVEKASIGSQVSKIKDFDNIREFFSSPLFGLLLEIPFILTYIIVSVIIAGYIILVPIISFVLFSLLIYLLKTQIKRTLSKTALFNSLKEEFLIESIDKLKTIKMSGAEDIWEKRYRSLSAKYCLHYFRSYHLNSIIRCVSYGLVILTGLGIICIGVYQVQSDQLSIGGLIATMLLAWKIINPIKTLFTNLSRFIQVNTSMKHILSLMRLPSEIETGINQNAAKGLSGKISLSNVYMRYGSEAPPVLLGINLTLKPGSLNMLTGSNGCGKSSILKLIARLYSPQAGAVYIDDIDIRQFDINEYRHNIGFVPQVVQFFYGTISQNLRLAHPTASMDDIVSATKRANVYEDIVMLPNGFNTRIRDNDKDLFSKTFLQNLAIARAILMKPKILLLDISTAQYNDKDKELFIQMLNELRKNTTVVMTTHSHSFLEIADRALTLENGRIISDVSGSELIRKGS